MRAKISKDSLMGVTTINTRRNILIKGNCSVKAEENLSYS